MRSAEPTPTLDVDWFRSRDAMTIVQRAPTTNLIVLGSSQPASLLAAADTRGVRRRGGGGAVAIDRDATIWIDLWVPRGEAPVDHDVAGGLRSVGELWRSALTRMGASTIDVVRAPSPHGGEVACFGGLGHGEIIGPRGAKVVGITAWRSREGSLYQCASYLEPCADLLVHALELSDAERRSLRAHLTTATELLDGVVPSIEPHADVATVRAHFARELRDAWVATGSTSLVEEVVLPEMVAGEHATIDEVE